VANFVLKRMLLVSLILSYLVQPRKATEEGGGGCTQRLLEPGIERCYRRLSRVHKQRCIQRLLRPGIERPCLKLSLKRAHRHWNTSDIRVPSPVIVLTGACPEHSLSLDEGYILSLDEGYILSLDEGYILSLDEGRSRRKGLGRGLSGIPGS